MNNKREANIEFLRRRQKRLRDNQEALGWLLKQRLSDKTMEFFRLGLAEPYLDNQKILHQNALLAPVRDKKGTFTNQTIYINIPEVTLNPTFETMWMKRSAGIYYAEKSDEQTSVIICENVWDVWLIWQALHENNSRINLLLLCPTPNALQTELSDEWRKPEFWDKFEKVYLGQSNTAPGDKMAIQIAQLAVCETRRLRPPINFLNWAEFWRSGGKLKEFYRNISDSSLIGTKISAANEANYNLPGRFGYKPVDITTAFHNGHLYYVTKTFVNYLDSTEDFQGEANSLMTSRSEVVVVKSDGTIHTVKEVPAPRGTPPEDRILRLTDGTLISSRPKASELSTWSWDAIEAYEQKRSSPRPLKKILSDVKTFLKKSVWLPFDYDYDLLTLLVPVTFAQAVFQAVPIVLVTGPAGTGKSALGTAMCRICSNAVSVGQVSAATVVRMISETKGFVLMDDLESIGRRSKKDSSQFSELMQTIKLSYNKATSWKVWTDVSRGMSVKRLNFFGVKMINNTTGTDDILGSRMLKIHTRRMPADLEIQIENNSMKQLTNLEFLRDELHTWTFQNVSLIDAVYKRLFPKPTDRSAEISAPLRVFAEISKDENLSNGLEKALEVKNEIFERPEDPIELMIKAVRKLARQGFTRISTTHIVLEMKTIMNRHKPEIHKFEKAKWENPAWVGRHLRTYHLIDVNAEHSRQWLFGQSLRIYPLNTAFRAEVLKDNATPVEYLERQALDFCQGCENCSYRFSDCPIMNQRLTAENRNH